MLFEARTIFLHIGAEKTGSTYLQNIFDGNVRLLEKKGIVYPYQLFYCSNHMELASAYLDDSNCHNVTVPSSRSGFRSDIKRFLMENRDRNILFSAEHLSSRLTALEEIDDLLKDLVSSGHVIKLICFLRDPESWIVSRYNQYIKSGGRHSLKTFLLEPGSISSSVARSLEYAKVLDRWCDHPMISDYSVVEYKYAKKKGILSCFLREIGLDTDCGFDIPVAIDPNLSLLGWQLKLMRLLNRSSFFRRLVIRKFVISFFNYFRLGDVYRFSLADQQHISKFVSSQLFFYTKYTDSK